MDEKFEFQKYLDIICEYLKTNLEKHTASIINIIFRGIHI